MQVLLDYCHYIGVRIMGSVDSVGVEILERVDVRLRFVKYHLECMGLLFSLPPLPALIFICLTSHMNRLNVVRLSKVLRGIVCKELGVSVGSLWRHLRTLREHRFVEVLGVGVYFINPYLASRCHSDQVKVLRARSIGHPLLYGGGIELGSGGV